MCRFTADIRFFASDNFQKPDGARWSFSPPERLAACFPGQKTVFDLSKTLDRGVFFTR